MGVNALYAKVQAYQCNLNPMILECAGDDACAQVWAIATYLAQHP